MNQLMNLDPLEINPGGRLSLDQIVGREREIERYWRILERQGLVLSSERRLGKTHIVLKMHGLRREGFVTFFQDLERVHALPELIGSIYKAVSSHLSTPGKVKEAAIDAWTSVAPKKIADLELPAAREHWKRLLSEAVADVLRAIPSDTKVVFFWDELPLMLYNLQKREGQNLTIELLDVLRGLRQEHGERLRFLFTGSIGLHLVLRSLRGAGNANNPINDMYQETVPAMVEDEAREVATRLLVRVRHAPRKVEPLMELVDLILQAVEGFPYYIHHIADHLNTIRRPITQADVVSAIDELVFADRDPAHLAYNIERIRTYYSADEARLSFLVLDIVARRDGPTPIGELQNLVRHELPGVSDQEVHDVCHLLRTDHYLTRAGDKNRAAYDFRWRLVKRWWRGTRT
jgi:hypothetical protein